MKLIYTITLLLTVLLSALAFADGGRKALNDNLQGTTTVRPLTADPNDNLNPFAIADGTGKMIVSWDQPLSASGYDVSAQLMVSNANIAWGPNGAAVANALFSQRNPVAVSDGQGGAIIVWELEFSTTDHDIWAQHVANSGAPLWTSGSLNGLVISEGLHEEKNPVIATDGSGGLFFARY